MSEQELVCAPEEVEAGVLLEERPQDNSMGPSPPRYLVSLTTNLQYVNSSTYHLTNDLPLSSFCTNSTTSSFAKLNSPSCPWNAYLALYNGFEGAGGGTPGREGGGGTGADDDVAALTGVGSAAGVYFGVGATFFCPGRACAAGFGFAGFATGFGA